MIGAGSLPGVDMMGPFSTWEVMTRIVEVMTRIVSIDTSETR